MQDAYYIIEKSDLLDAAESYRKARIKYYDEINSWARSLNIEAWKTNFSGKVWSVKFKEGLTPEGFKKPCKYGCVVPYARNKDWKDIIDTAPVEPFHYEYITKDILDVPSWIHYEFEGGSGSSSISMHHIHDYHILWLSEDSPMCLVMTDFEKYIKDFYKNQEKCGYKNTKITSDIESFKVPECLKRILKEEWQLMVALEKKKNEENE